MKFCVFSSDPLYKYAAKGELRQRYWNPEGMFDEVLVLTFADEDVEPARVQRLVGDARLTVQTLGSFRPQRLAHHLRRARQCVAAFGPDLIRAHNPWHVGLVATRVARHADVPLVLSLHTSYPDRRRHEGGLRLQILRLFERYTIPGADVVLCVSEYLTDYAATCGARRVEVIYNRVYVDQFAGAPQPRRDSQRPTILSVGRLDPPKDQACLIEAVHDLDANLVLVGDGANRERLQRLVGQLQMGERVTFTPSVPHERIQEVYAGADIFALATAYEGFGIPVLEAMAAGLPVVVNDCGPLVELVGDAGIVVPLAAQAFRRALGDLLDDLPAARALGARAQERARLFDGSIMEAREADLYRELTEVDTGRGAAAPAAAASAGRPPG